MYVCRTNNNNVEQLNQIQNTIIEQMGGRFALMMMGTLNIPGGIRIVENPSAVEFKIKGSPKFNLIRVELLPSDTYKLTFSKYTKTGDLKAYKALSGVYCDDLKPMIESNTGLFLSLYLGK